MGWGPVCCTLVHRGTISCLLATSLTIDDIVLTVGKLSRPEHRKTGHEGGEPYCAVVGTVGRGPIPAHISHLQLWEYIMLLPRLDLDRRVAQRETRSKEKAVDH